MKAEEKPMFQIKPFDYVLWVDPNNITQELQIFQFYLGANKIKHFKSMEQTQMFVKKNQQFRYFLVVSGRVYKEHEKTMDDFLSKMVNVFRKLIIFCFDKKLLLKYQKIKHVEAIENEDIKVVEILSKKAKKLQQNCLPHYPKIRMVFLDLKEHRSTEDVYQYLSVYFWKGMKINIFTEQTEFDGLNQLEDARQLYYILAFPEHIKYKDITKKYLSTYQGIIGWYFLMDSENTHLLPESEDIQEFIHDINIKIFFKALQHNIIKKYIPD